MGLPKWEFSTGKKHFMPRKKKQEKFLCPLRKICLLRPCMQCKFIDSVSTQHHRQFQVLKLPSPLIFLLDIIHPRIWFLNMQTFELSIYTLYELNITAGSAMHTIQIKLSVKTPEGGGIDHQSPPQVTCFCTTKRFGF